LLSRGFYQQIGLGATDLAVRPKNPLKRLQWAPDKMLCCRINAAFRIKVERRIYAAERGARRNLSCAQSLQESSPSLAIGITV
jgi:hypothetical protein